MDEISSLRKNISDLIAVLSLITKRAPEVEQDDNEPSISEPPAFGSDVLDPGLECEQVDEAEFEDTVVPGDAELEIIKRKALDRLAEALARFKTAGGSKEQKKQNSDAKHVTSMAMAEDLENKSVTFYCAKNEGLDADDADFLKRLEDILRNIAGTNEAGDRQTEQVNQVFDTLFNHQRPRVEYYSQALRNAIKQASQTTATPKTLTNRNVQEGLLLATSMYWKDDNGLQFSFGLGGSEVESASNKAVDCLSDQDEESLVQKVCSEIWQLFGSASNQSSEIAVKNLLRKVYRIVRHPRQRPALKGLLRHAVHNKQRLFREAWSSLLYLTRIFHAAVSLVDLATRSNWVSFRFREVPATISRAPKKLDKRRPTDVLASLGHPSLSRNWLDFFQNAARVGEFTRLARLKKTVHGEVQLILHVDGLGHAGSDNLAGKLFPYIGCSRKCCFFCDLFREQHGTFQARGTHETLFPLWALPNTSVIPLESLPMLRQFSDCLREILRGLLAMSYPPLRRDLLQQSSAALSTAQAVQREVLTYSERPLALRRMMLGVNITLDHQLEFLPSTGTPGQATLMGGSSGPGVETMPIEEAEKSKINHERSSYSLEKMDEMPRLRDLGRNLCRRCKSRAKYRCSACWSRYCSPDCQKRNWASHVFTCRVATRPNDVDFLRLTTRRILPDINSGDAERIQNGLLHLFADDHLCTTFGFNNCISTIEVLNLICLYRTMFSRVRPSVRVLQERLATGDLGEFMENFCQIERYVAQHTNETECTCVTLFLERRSLGSFPIPNGNETAYNIGLAAVTGAIDCLDLAERFDSGYRLNEAQADVFDLYVEIQPNHWLIPDVYSSSWIKFGFCSCNSFAQRLKLAQRYLKLAYSAATFDEIVSAYGNSSLAELMRIRGIDIAELENQGVRLHKPAPCEYSVYRLMIGVEHALSGRFCSCFRVRKSRRCHGYYETHIDRESDTNFGFHLTSSWERWQLLNFYKVVFREHGFNPHQMAAAVEDANLESLETYLNTLVPDMRGKLSDLRQASPLFPLLKNRLRGRTSRDGPNISHFHLPCDCKVHDVVQPPGISHLGLGRILDGFRTHGCQ